MSDTVKFWLLLILLLLSVVLVWIANTAANYVLMPHVYMLGFGH